MLRKEKLKNFLSIGIRNLFSSFPASAMFCLGSTYARSLLWTENPIKNHSVFLEMLSYEVDSVILFCPASAFVLFIINLILGDGRSKSRMFLSILSGIALTYIASILIAGALNFSLCYGGPKEGCTEVQLSNIHYAALCISFLWAFMTLFIDRLFRSCGWGSA